MLAVISTPGAATAQGPSTEPGASARLSWTPTGHLQLDSRSFADWDLVGSEPRLQREAFEVRRARLGLDLSWRAWRGELSVDPLDEDGTWLKDARAEVRPARWLRVHGGQFKLPGGREYGTSTRRLGFLERSMLSESLAAGRDLGGLVELRPGRGVQAEIGLFAGDGRGREERAGLTSAARIGWQARRRLDLGGSLSIGRVRAGADADATNGINGRSTTSYRFFDRLYVHGRRTRVGADLEWRPRRWQVNVEAMRLTEQRRGQAASFEDLPALAARAATASVRWQPERHDVGVRVEWMAFDDVGPDTGAASVRPRAADVRARASRAVTVSAGRQLAQWLRVLGELASEHYSDARTAPTPGRTGPYLVAGVRLQVELP